MDSYHYYYSDFVDTDGQHRHWHRLCIQQWIVWQHQLHFNRFRFPKKTVIQVPPDILT
jgi:hypothetical protein